MAEYIRNVEIRLLIDTNKRTVERTYHSVESALEDLKDIEENGL